MKIVHICQDYPWVKGAHALFENAFPNANEFLVIKPPANPPLKHLKALENLKVLKRDSYLKGKVFNYVDDANLVVLHGLNGENALWVKESETPQKFLWLAMGADIYGNPFIYSTKLFGVKTGQLKDKLEKHIGIKTKMKNLYRRVRYGLKPNKGDHHKTVSEASGKISFFASFQYEQFKLVKDSGHLKKGAEFLHFSFYPLERMVSKELYEDSNPVGNNILLGNSASFTNNHLEAIDLISELGLGKLKVYCPLSYGNEQYAKKVIKYGKQHLGEVFTPVKEFLPLDQYNDILKSCGVVIINTYRGQAAGNILSTLFQGSKVFLSEKNLIYHYLKRIGCFVYSVEGDLPYISKQAIGPLASSKVAHNQLILKSQLSESVLINELQTKIPAYLSAKNLG